MGFQYCRLRVFKENGGDLKKCKETTSLFNFTFFVPYTSAECPLELLCQQLKQEAPHRWLPDVGSLLMIFEYLWWCLKWFQLQRVTEGLSSSTRVAECRGLSECCQSMVSSRIQRRLRRPGYRFCRDCDPGRWEGDYREDSIFPQGKSGFEIRQLGDHPQVNKMGCMHCVQQRNQHEFKESVFFQCSCHTSGLVTGDRANQTSHGICGDDARALGTAQGG